jgi:hypothetical protein
MYIFGTPLQFPSRQQFLVSGAEILTPKNQQALQFFSLQGLLIILFVGTNKYPS